MEYIKKIYVEGKGLDFQLSRKKIYLDLFRFKLISEIEFILLDKGILYYHILVDIKNQYGYKHEAVINSDEGNKYDIKALLVYINGGGENSYWGKQLN